MTHRSGGEANAGEGVEIIGIDSSRGSPDLDDMPERRMPVPVEKPRARQPLASDEAGLDVYAARRDRDQREDAAFNEIDRSDPFARLFKDVTLGEAQRTKVRGYA